MTDQKDRGSEERESRLNAQTLVPVGLSVTVILAVASAAMWLQASLGGITSRLDISLVGITSKLETIQRDLNQVSGRVDVTWTRADMMVWVQLLRATNPTISIPEVPR